MCSLGIAQRRKKPQPKTANARKESDRRWLTNGNNGGKKALTNHTGTPKTMSSVNKICVLGDKSWRGAD